MDKHVTRKPKQSRGVTKHTQQGPVLNIRGIDKVKLLQRLWANQAPHEFFERTKTPLPKFGTRVEARKHVEKGYIGHYRGRLIRANLTQDEADFTQYDGHAKTPAAAVVNELAPEEESDEHNSN